MEKRNAFFVMGIEGGGSRTTWVLADSAGRPVRDGVVGPCNTQHRTDVEIIAILREIRKRAAMPPLAIGAAFAGCHLASERKRLTRLIHHVWPEISRCVVDEDTGSAFAAAHGNKDGVVVIAGTGSNVFGRRGQKRARAGGWGNIFSDQGSGYDIARRGLEAVFDTYDENKKCVRLARRFIDVARVNDLESLVPWVLHHASKEQIASLAPLVLEAAAQGDRLARKVIDDGVDRLSDRVCYVARRLGLLSPPVALVGGLMVNSPFYSRVFARAVIKKLPGSTVFVCATPGALGAASLVILK